jgi:hypothetical protein
MKPKVNPTVNLLGRGAPSPFYPTCSWWVGVSREEFRIVVAREYARMVLSRFGRVERVVTEGAVEAPRRAYRLPVEDHEV